MISNRHGFVRLILPLVDVVAFELKYTDALWDKRTIPGSRQQWMADLITHAGNEVARRPVTHRVPSLPSPCAFTCP
jgi:hypothetical protein